MRKRWKPSDQFPNLSKSAPCGCCGTTTQNTCLACNAFLTGQTLTLLDGQWGSCTLTYPGSGTIWTGEISGISISGTTNCNTGASGIVSTKYQYQFQCSTVSNIISVIVRCWSCISTGLPANSAETPTYAFYNLTLVSVSGITLTSAPHDCSSPNFVLNVTAKTPYYPSNTTLTIT